MKLPKDECVDGKAEIGAGDVNHAANVIPKTEKTGKIYCNFFCNKLNGFLIYHLFWYGIQLVGIYVSGNWMQYADI